jgi:sortase A
MEEQAVIKTTKKNKGGAGLNVMIVLFALVLLGGIGLIAYPTFANWWNSMHASRAVAGYVEQVNDMSGEQKKELLDQAHAYNTKLNTLPDRWHLTDEQMDEYNKTLDITGTGIMGYITIPKLEVRLPVYHGTEDTVLQIAGRIITAGRWRRHARRRLRAHRTAVGETVHRPRQPQGRRHLRLPCT